MSLDAQPPDLATWAGGLPAIERLMRRFYAEVSSHPLLGPRFAAMPKDHADRVAAFVHEVMSGTPTYSSLGGTHATMIAHHVGRNLTEEERSAWFHLLLACADEAGLPNDPEFRACLAGYFEWGSRLAVINSHADAPPNESGSMPRWTWSSPGGPFSGESE